MPDPRPPQPEDVPMQGESETWKGTNPWSGPYLVLAILGLGLVVLAVFLVGPLLGLGG